MARTFAGKTRFQFRITLAPADAAPPRKPWVGTGGWKRRAIYLIRMKLTIQIEKAANRTAWEWYKFYSVRGYGVPGRLEFICPYSGMVAKTLEQEEAVSARKYWGICARKSREILAWLDKITPSRYSKELHVYLLRLIVVPYNKREIDGYCLANPFELEVDG